MHDCRLCPRVCCLYLLFTLAGRRTHTNTHRQSCRTAVAACQYSSVANRWIEDADETERERERERDSPQPLPPCLKSLPQLLESFSAAASGWKGVVAAVTMCTSERLHAAQYTAFKMYYKRTITSRRAPSSQSIHLGETYTAPLCNKETQSEE